MKIATPAMLKLIITATEFLVSDNTTSLTTGIIQMRNEELLNRKENTHINSKLNTSCMCIAHLLFHIEPLTISAVMYTTKQYYLHDGMVVY